MHSRLASGLVLALVSCAVVGCATPGPPKPPTLNLPEVTRDLSATRIGDAVELRLTVPSRSTDKLPLRGGNVTARFCRSVESQPCQPLPPAVVGLDIDQTNHASFTWTDTLPTELAQGNARLLRYTVELMNVSGRSAGRSEPAFTAAGAAPAPVAGLDAQGSRLGIVLRWDEAAGERGEIVVQRESLAKAAVVQLTAPAGSSRNSLLDTSVKLDTAYGYVATRVRTVKVGDRMIEVRSSPSARVELALKPIYPPLAPVGLTAAASGESAFAIDLIWQPVDDGGLIVPLAGYNVYRADGEAVPRRLNEGPIALPAFHDETAVAGRTYRYRVTAVDVKGNESGAISVVFGP